MGRKEVIRGCLKSEVQRFFEHRELGGHVALDLPYPST